MSPALTSGHAVDQSVKTLVHGKSRVALSRQSQAPGGTDTRGCESRRERHAKCRGARAANALGELRETGIPTRSCERLAEDEAEQPMRC